MHSFLPKRQYTVGFCFYLVCLLTDFLSQFSLHPAVLPVNRRRLFRLGDLGQPRRYLRHGGREYAATVPAFPAAGREWAATCPAQHSPHRQEACFPHILEKGNESDVGDKL